MDFWNSDVKTLLQKPLYTTLAVGRQKPSLCYCAAANLFTTPPPINLTPVFCDTIEWQSLETDGDDGGGGDGDDGDDDEDNQMSVLRGAE